MKTSRRDGITTTQTGIIVIIVAIIIITGAYFGLTSLTPSSSTTTSSTSVPSQVLIGLPASTTGYATPFGTSCSQGAQWEAAQINKTGGINGAMIKLVQIDDESTAAQGSTVGSELVGDHVIGVVSCSTDEPLLAMGPELDAAGIPEIVSLSGGPTVTVAIHDAFKMQLDASVQGFAAAKYLAGVLGQTKIAVLISDQSYTDLAAQAFVSALSNYTGATVVYTKTTQIGTSATDYASIMTSIQASGATAIFFALFPPDAPTAIAQMGAAGIHDVAFATDTTDAGGNGTSNVAYGIAKQSLTGVYWPSLFLSTAPGAASFISSYNSTYGHPPDFFAALGHDSVLVMADAIKAGGFTSSGILGALPTIHDSTLLTGSLNGFTADHRRIMPINIVQWKGTYTNLVVTYDQASIITPSPLPTTTTTAAIPVYRDGRELF